MSFSVRGAFWRPFGTSWYVCISIYLFIYNICILYYVYMYIYMYLYPPTYIYMCVYLDFWIQICILRQCIISDHICKFLWLHFGYINHQNAEIQQWPQKMSRMKHWLLVSNIIFTPTYLEKWPNLTSNIFTNFRQPLYLKDFWRLPVR